MPVDLPMGILDRHGAQIQGLEYYSDKDKSTTYASRNTQPEAIRPNRQRKVSGGGRAGSFQDGRCRFVVYGKVEKIPQLTRARGGGESCAKESTKIK